MMSLILGSFHRLLLIGLAVGLLVSPVAAQETVCLQCHGGLQGHLGDPVALWRDSIHAAHGNSCHGCHGGDPSDMANAMSPERGFIGVPADEEIPAFCGRCHVGVLEDYLKSAHGQALGAGGPQCVTCHGPHAVKKASIELINQEDCSRCHEYGRAEELKAAIADTEGRFVALEGDLTELKQRGQDVKALQEGLFASRNDFHRLLHSVDVDLVKEQAAGFQGKIGEMDGKVGAIREELSSRKLWGGVATGLLVLGGVLFSLLRKTYQEQERADKR
ncbi:MAG: cytochrome c3 family protein [Trichloromonadaceae bacterium]